MDLARAKGKTLVNICSLFKQKIESCNVKRRRQRKRKTNQQKKQLCTCSTLFLVHFFPVLLHDYNVKLPVTSQLHVLWRTDIVCVAGNFFFAAAYFHLVGRQHFSLFFLCIKTKKNKDLVDTPGGLCRKRRPWSKFCLIEDIVVSYTSMVEIPVSRYL